MPDIDFLNYLDEVQDDIDDLVVGLSDNKQKRLNPKYFYDEKGSILFDQITEAIDYYPTRKEMEILELEKDKIKDLLPSNSTIVEFGSGSNKKIKKLLNILQLPERYISLDISKDFLLKNAEELSEFFPSLKITAICADFNQNLEIPMIRNIRNPKIGFFPGSTIGNFHPIEAKNILKKFAKVLTTDNFLVVGVDLKKKKEILEKAYNDSDGVTEKFNKNIFNSINKKFGTKFDKNYFKHKAFFNNKENRIEMHLVSQKDHSVNLLNTKVTFRIGESIHTENSYKYSISSFTKLIKDSGYQINSVLKDKDEYFGIFILKIIS